MMHLTIIAGYGARRDRLRSRLPARARHNPVHPLDAVRGAERAGAQPTRERSARLAVAKMLVTGRAHAHPGGEFVSNRAAVQALALIAQLFRNCFPLCSVPGTGPSHGMRNLVQEHLVDFVILVARSEILRHGDAFVGVVAEPCASLGVVESELPTLIQVQSDKRFRPHAHSGKFSHLLRLIDESLAQPHGVVGRVDCVGVHCCFDGCRTVCFSLCSGPTTLTLVCT